MSKVDALKALGQKVTGQSISGDTVCEALTDIKNKYTATDLTNYYTKTQTDALVGAKSAVSVSPTGEATDEVQYITVDGTEKKIKSGSTVAVSASGTATDEVQYITVDGTEKKIKSGSAVSVAQSGTSTTEAKYLTVDGSEYKVGGLPEGIELIDGQRLFVGSATYTSGGRHNNIGITTGNRRNGLGAKTGSIAAGCFSNDSGGDVLAEGCGVLTVGYSAGGTVGVLSNFMSYGCLVCGISNSSSSEMYAKSAQGSIMCGEAHGGVEGNGFAVFGRTNKAGNYKVNDALIHGRCAIQPTQDNQYAEICGNGVFGSQTSNAYTLDWQGNAVFAGTVSSVGSDFAEYFEWADGNTDAEDRIGYLVALDGEKIKKAGAGDEIIGAISGTATVLGDNAEWYWHKRFLQDEFGRFIYEDYDIEHPAIVDDEGHIVQPAWTEHIHARKKNPDWDEDEPYIRREDRPEWAIVGLLGKIYVRDDGTASAGDYVTAVNGVATKSLSPTNVRVLKRTSANVIWCLMR